MSHNNNKCEKCTMKYWEPINKYMHARTCELFRNELTEKIWRGEYPLLSDKNYRYYEHCGIIQYYHLEFEVIKYCIYKIIGEDWICSYKLVNPLVSITNLEKKYYDKLVQNPFYGRQFSIARNIFYTNNKKFDASTLFPDVKKVSVSLKSCNLRS